MAAETRRIPVSTPGFCGSLEAMVGLDALGKITSLSVSGKDDRFEIGRKAIEEVSARILSAGSADVDAVSGATVTSKAVIDACKRATREARGIPMEEASGMGAGRRVRMKPGCYTGYSKGFWQMQELPVTIKVNETAILKISVPEDRFAHGETEVILDSVKKDLFPRIIENQSINVDSTTGATISSAAVKNAVRQALAQALEAGGSQEEAIDEFLREPEPIPVGAPIEKDVDILVVGLGDGGIMAACSAMETIQEINKPGDAKGFISLLAIDRAARFGGKSALCHEGCCANPPEYSKVVNNGEPLVDDEFFKNQWIRFASKDGKLMAKREVLDMYFAESGKTVDWLYGKHGFIFGTMGRDDQMVGGHVRYNVALENNVNPGTYEDRRRVKAGYHQAMLDKVVAQGGEYLLDTEGYEFIMDGERVAGVKARNLHSGQEYLIHAKAVIMNTGGFCGNQQMIDTLLGEHWRGQRFTLGTSQDTGAMFQAALNIGAGTYNIDASPISMACGPAHWISHFPINYYDGMLDGRTGRYKAWTLNNIPHGCGALSDGIAVDKEGRRYLNEYRFCDFAWTIDEDSFNFFKAGNYHWGICSDDLLRSIAEEGFTSISRWDGYRCQGDIPKGRPVPEVYEGMDVAVAEGLAVKADTVAELAQKMGVDPAVLEGTFARYNAMCDAGEDADFGKDPKYLRKLVTPPFYAVKMYAFSFGTQGGLDVDEQIRVLRDDHVTPIDGLYAVGLDSMGVLLAPERGYAGFGGVAQGWLWTSGRMAGINAAKYVHERFGLTEKGCALCDIAAHADMGKEHDD